MKLRLPQPVVFRAALPQIAVDGRVIGVAERAADGRTISLLTSNARVVKAKKVQLAWNGAVAGAGSQNYQASARTAQAAAPVGPVLEEDPAAPGPYGVERADYDLGDTAVRLAGLRGQAVEMRAAVYLPKGAEGARPVAVFLHGMHQFCYGKTTGTPAINWPCTKGMKPVPSYLGYESPAKALASHGYAVVSISANGVNATLDESAPDAGTQARGELVLAHLDQLRQWVSDSDSQLSGRLDLSNVGLMGHSRGGEGVVTAAALNSARPSPYGIRAVLPLAPTDFARNTLPGAAMAVILPYCDGDVSDQQGQHFYDDSRYAGKDNVLRTTLTMLGANHNFFNTEWTPATSKAGSFDDWGDKKDPVCGRKAPGRLSPKQQQAVGAAYLSGFFRLNLGDEQQFLPMFDGTNGRAKSAGQAVVYTQAQQPSASRTDLASFALPKASVTTSKAASYCAGAGNPPSKDKRLLPACAKSDGWSTDFPHWVPSYFAPDVPTTSVARLKWTTKTKPRTLVSIKASSPTAREALTFRAATLSSKAGLDVTVTDRSGAKATVSVAKVSNALSPLPRLQGSAKVIMQTVRIPLTSFKGVDPGAIAQVSFARASKTGDVVLADLALDTPSSVIGGPTALPAASIGDQIVFERNKSQRVRIPVNLSRPSSVPVVVNVDTNIMYGEGRVPAKWVKVTFPAGKTKAVAEIRMRGNRKAEPLARLDMTLSAPRNAIVGDPWGILTVYDDDTA
ncbi:hypothetical protein GCM10027456_32220 [Kineosporia babensis]